MLMCGSAQTFHADVFPRRRAHLVPGQCGYTLHYLGAGVKLNPHGLSMSRTPCFYTQCLEGTAMTQCISGPYPAALRVPLLVDVECLINVLCDYTTGKPWKSSGAPSG